MDEKIMHSLERLAYKEQALSNIIVWLKAKNLWDECKKDIGWGEEN